MSGHSKWHNIQRTKNANDAAKAKVVTKISREILVCIREGGNNPENNGKLRDLITKAKANNVPNDNINRLLAKGNEDKTDYEANTYEGYGIGGIAVMVETLTDNKNRTAGDIRSYFSKYGGNMGTLGCVSYLFNQKGVIIAEAPYDDEENIMEDSVESGAEDYAVDREDDETTVRFELAPDDLHNAVEYLQSKKYTILNFEVAYVPMTTIKLTDEEHIKKMNQLIDKLEENDDVQNVYHNWLSE
ncbi:MAG: YebC/PmpR family DNA-binding transcriptional regulator [Oscillospiraceae bacterium]|jgi:YebC/PmpR family DNA-binding regulatory protein|nr:YebC/PmpR family DNA-binding transcriptional regulator [Oscillospiraceae bacterium]